MWRWWCRWTRGCGSGGGAVTDVSAVRFDMLSGTTPARPTPLSDTCLHGKKQYNHNSTRAHTDTRKHTQTDTKVSTMQNKHHTARAAHTTAPASHVMPVHASAVVHGSLELGSQPVTGPRHRGPPRAANMSVSAANSDGATASTRQHGSTASAHSTASRSIDRKYRSVSVAHAARAA
jgi:hypothetical protein